MAAIKSSDSTMVGSMRVALLSDIHANLPAFHAVLDDLPQVDSVVCLGDVVGYYADPNEVCDLLIKRQIVTIRGNHDAYVLGELTPRANRDAAYRTSWTREILTPKNVTWLRSLPTGMHFRWGRFDVQLRHATPWDEEGYLYPDSDLNQITLAPDQLLAVGHTHWPMLRQCGQGLVLNPGSVGQPRDCNPKAAYAILDADSGSVDFRRVTYDVGDLQRRLQQIGWDPDSVAVLSRTSR